MMNLVIIAGGGRFGLKAVEYIKKYNYPAVLIDNNPNCFAAKFATKKFEEFNFNIKDLKDGEIFFLNQDIEVVIDLINKLVPEIIIPVAPIHLMASLLSSFLLKYSIRLIPDVDVTKIFSDNINPELLLNHISDLGAVYLSYAKIDELCPDNCSGPITYCPNFKREKPITITDYVKEYLETTNTVKVKNGNISEIVVVNESYQLMPGLGGLKGKDMQDTLNILQENISILSSQKFKISIATTCNCHGVINFYKNY